MQPPDWTPEEQARHRAELDAVLAEGEARGRHHRPRRERPTAERPRPSLTDREHYAQGTTLQELLDAW